MTKGVIHRNPNIQILKRCARGSQKSQKQIYETYYRFAYSITIQYLDREEDIVEVVNDSFIKAFVMLYTTVPDNFLAWLRRIVIHTAIDRFRQISAQRFDLIEDLPRFSDTVIVPNEIIENLSAKEILKLLGKLKEIERCIFLLYEVEGYHHDEIAGLLQIETGTSRSHLSRGKKKLRNYLTNSQNDAQSSN